MSSPDEAAAAFEKAAFQPEFWPAALEVACAALDANVINVLRQAKDGDVAVLTCPRGEAALRVYEEENWAEHDLRTKRGLGGATDLQVLTDEMLLTRDELDNGLFYRDFAKRFDVPRLAGWGLSLESGNFAVSAIRSWREGPADAAFMRKLEAFRARGATAVAVSAMLAHQKLTSMFEGFDIAGTAAIGLDRRGEALIVNRNAEALFDASFGVRAGRIVINDARAGRAFAQLREAFVSPGEPYLPFRLNRASPNPPLLALPMRAPDIARDFFSGLDTVLMLKVIGRPREAPAERLRVAFGLTKSEAEIAAHLLQGADINAIAAARAVKPDTVRQMVKAVLFKTGAHRQSELVAILASIG